MAKGKTEKPAFSEGELPGLREITLSHLESHLWEFANILRGPVDAAGFKTYVFQLLFFKRISDVHDEKYQAAPAESVEKADLLTNLGHPPQ